MATVTYRAYRRTARRSGAVTLVHGRYDGLATAPVVHAHDQLFVPLAGRMHVAPCQSVQPGAAGKPVGGPGRVLGPEEAAWIPAGLAHAASSLGGATDFIALNAPPGWLTALAARHGLPAPAGNALTPLRDPGLWLAAQLLARTLAAPPGGAAWLDASVLQLGLLALAAGPAPQPSGDAAILAAVERILSHHAEPLTVAALAEACGLGERQFERRFKATAGCAPRAFLTTVRLAAARERLRTSDEPIEAIAQAAGFADPTHFGRAFKAASGLPPAAWRRHERNLNL